MEDGRVVPMDAIIGPFVSYGWNGVGQNAGLLIKKLSVHIFNEKLGRGCHS